MRKSPILATLLLAGCVAQTPHPVPNASTAAAPTPAPVAASSATPGPIPVAIPASQASDPAVIPWQHLPSLPFGEPPSTAAAWARSSKDIYVVAGKPEVWHYDGTSWARQTVPGAGNLVSLTGDASAVYVGGGEGSLYKGQGGQWSRLTEPATATYWGLARETDGTVLVAGDDSGAPVHLLLPTAMTNVLVGTGMGYAAASLNGNRFVVGAKGYAAWQSNGGQWQQGSQPIAEDLRAIVAYTGGRSPVDAMAVGAHGATVRISGGKPESFGSNTTVDLNTVAAVTANGLFAGGDRGLVLYFDSDAWRTLINEPKLGDVLALYAIADRQVVLVSSTGAVYVGPSGLLL